MCARFGGAMFETRLYGGGHRQPECGVLLDAFSEPPIADHVNLGRGWMRYGESVRISELSLSPVVHCHISEEKRETACASPPLHRSTAVWHAEQ